MSVCRLSRCGGALLLALLLSLLLVGQLEARPRIALVLSGGGAKGAAHLGVLKVLEQERVPVDMVRKAIRAGVPALVSKSMPTVQSAELAAEYGLQLVCGRKFPKV
jgi:hypothetical protein